MATDQKKRKASLWTAMLKLTVITFLLEALPFIANFTAGAIAGISEILTFYPLGEKITHTTNTP